MAVYTCFDMIQDCRAGRPEGWNYFILHFVPACRSLLRHYHPDEIDDSELLHRVLLSFQKPESGLFASPQPMPEREFVAEVRQLVVAALEQEREHEMAPIPLSLETLSSALHALTVVEKQTAWLETMRYNTADTSVIMHMAPETVEHVREKTANLLRESMDHWNRHLLADNGPALAREAFASKPEDALPMKTFLDAIDGRVTWSRRQEMERQLSASWHDIDRFCRAREADFVLHHSTPLTREETERFRQLFGVRPPRRSFWKRVLARG